MIKKIEYLGFLFDSGVLVEVVLEAEAPRMGVPLQVAA